MGAQRHDVNVREITWNVAEHGRPPAGFEFFLSD
jgi:hypothetical protein